MGILRVTKQGDHGPGGAAATVTGEARNAMAMMRSSANRESIMIASMFGRDMRYLRYLRII